MTQVKVILGLIFVFESAALDSTFCNLSPNPIHRPSKACRVLGETPLCTHPFFLQPSKIAWSRLSARFPEMSCIDPASPAQQPNPTVWSWAALQIFPGSTELASEDRFQAPRSRVLGRCLEISGDVNGDFLACEPLFVDFIF